MRPVEGGWLMVGELKPGRAILWWHNPRHLLPAAWSRVVALFRLSQGGMARGWLPEAGGVNAQPAWLMDAFAVLAAEEARLEKRSAAKKEGG
jgi:hypothetical protein